MINIDDVRNHTEVGTGYTKDAMLNLCADEIETLRAFKASMQVKSEPVAEVINNPWPQGICPADPSGRWYQIRALEGEMLPHGTKLYTEAPLNKPVFDERAIEHGEYLAKSAESFLDYLNSVSDVEEGTINPDDNYGDFASDLRSMVYEFRKRAERKLTTNTETANQDDNDWAFWNGSHSAPFLKTETVDIKRRNGEILTKVQSCDYNWSRNFLATQHHIVAYRISPASQLSTPGDNDAIDALLIEARDSLASGLETDGYLEAEHSVSDKDLIKRIDLALSARKP